MRIKLDDGTEIDVPVDQQARLCPPGWDEKSWHDFGQVVSQAQQQLRQVEDSIKARFIEPGEALQQLRTVIKTLEAGKMAAEWAL